MNAAVVALFAFVLPLAVEVEPFESVAELIARGRALLESGDLIGARGAFGAARRVDTDSVEASLGLARASRRLGDVTGAASLLRESLARAEASVATDATRGERVDALERELARCLVSLERFAEAASALDRVLARAPGSAAALVERGVLELRRGNVDEALRRLELAVKIAPEHGAALGNLAAALTRSGRLEDAVGAYRRAVAVDPESALSHYGLATSLEKLGRLEDAAAAARRAIELDASLGPAHYRLANLSFRLGDRETGLASLRRFRRLKAVSHYGAATRALAEGDTRGAIRELERALDAHPALVDAHAELARLRLRDDPPLAISHATTAARLEPRAPRFAALAWTLLEAGEPRRALKWIEKAIESAPESREYRELGEEIRGAARGR